MSEQSPVMEELAGVDEGSTAHTAPNIVLIVADDLDARSLDQMPQLNTLLQARGMTFSRFYVTTPICCPARASILRGQYAHNHGVLRNNGDRGGFHTFHLEGRENSTLATWLHDAGYRTALVGKYLNGYPRLPPRLTDTKLPRTYVPPGWDEWYAQLGRGAAGGSAYQLNENGGIVDYDDRPEHYSTDVFGHHATRFIERIEAGEDRFFLYIATVVPHYPSDPAPRHAPLFAGAEAPRPPSFDEPDARDKPRHLRSAPRFSAEQITAIDQHYGDRLRALQSLDDLIIDVVDALKARDIFDQTCLIVTSDHGWHLGEHRLPFGKETPYEESIRAPLALLGPAIRGGRTVDTLTLNIDLAPTIAELAGVTVPEFVDGRSFAPLLRGQEPIPWRRSFLVEHTSADKTRAYPDLGSMPDIPSYRALRATMLAGDLLYVEYETGERELYDIRSDPYQMKNSSSSAAPAMVDRLAGRLNELRICRGSTCRVVEDNTLEIARGNATTAP